MSGEAQIWRHPDPSCNPGPAAREVHVWRATLSRSADQLSKLGGELPLEEQERADRFRLEHDRMRFLLGRLIARTVLARCLQQPPREIRLILDDSKKPSVASSSLHFNISHSGDYILLALARDRRIGVDIERLREVEDMNEIATRYFSKVEQSCLNSAARETRMESFFRCWTMKEAYIKARGEGFGLALDSFDVAFLAGESPRLLATRFDSADAGRWSFHRVDVGPDHVAALATESPSQLELKLWDWSGWRATT